MKKTIAIFLGALVAVFSTAVWAPYGPGINNSISQLTSVTKANTIASTTAAGAQTWTWTSTTDGLVSWTIQDQGSINGTSTSGVPNQVIVKLNSTGTASPLSVYSHGIHLMSATPHATTPQMIFGAGSISAPMITFNLSNGFYQNGSNVRATNGGNDVQEWRLNQNRFLAGSSAIPAITDLTTADSGLYWPASSGRMGVRGNIETTAVSSPTVGGAACGTSATISGSNNAITVTVGTGGVATTCTVLFGNAFSAAPACVAQNNTDRVSYSIASTTANVAITATAAFTAGSKFYIVCIG